MAHVLLGLHVLVVRVARTHPQGTDDASPWRARTISARRTTKPLANHKGICSWCQGLAMKSRSMKKQGRRREDRPEKNASVSIRHSFVCERREEEGGGRRRPSERAIGLLTSRLLSSGLLLLSYEFLPRSFWEDPHVLFCVLGQLWWWWRLST